MRAFVITELTGPAGGAVSEAPEPVGAHPWSDGRRLLVEVHAAGVSFPDVLQARGAYQHGIEVPYVSGGEVAGVVLEAPPGSRFVPGDRIAGLTVWGGLAERALVPPQYAVPLPPDMGFAEGAAFYLNYATAWFSLYRTGFRAGETVLVHGASGGVGTATVQVVTALGGRALAVVSSADKEQTARAAGASEVVRCDVPWLERVRELTDGRGVDVVVDPVGGDRFVDSLRSLDVGGRLAVVGFAAGTIPTVKVNRLLLRDLSVVGVALEPFVRRHPEVADELARALLALAADPVVSPFVGHRLPFESARQALELIESRSAAGKVVVEIGPG
ncbi:MAG: NADPH:quinone oxidoreductase family protein [Frankiales bacterium]|nr:NADPH:quinone oxidoreductase family protein [Frankiales bacterium]